MREAEREDEKDLGQSCREEKAEREKPGHSCLVRTAVELLLPVAPRLAPTPAGLDGPGREVGQSGGSSVLQLTEVSRKEKQQFLAEEWLP